MSEPEEDALTERIDEQDGEPSQPEAQPKRPARHALLMGLGLAAWVVANIGMRVLSPIQESLAARVGAGDQSAVGLALLAAIPGILNIVLYAGGLLLLVIGAIMYFFRAVRPTR